MFMLRQAGFPMDLLDPLRSPAAVDVVRRLRTAETELGVLAGEVRALLAGNPVAGKVMPLVGQLLPLPGALLAGAAGQVDDRTAAALREYSDHAAQLRADWDSFAADYEKTSYAHRDYVAALFREDVALREVLLLSNDAQFDQFSRWLDGSRDGRHDRRARRVTDMLTMYLQRLTTKNETHAHFGPISVGRFDPAATGLSWSAAELSRYPYFSHWAAEEIGRVLSERPELRDAIRPRRRPLALADNDVVHLFASTTTTGFTADWSFGEQCRRELSGDERWVFDRADGSRTLAELAAQWPGDRAGLDRVVTELCAADLLVTRFEPVLGEPDPLRGLRSQLPSAHEELDRFSDLVSEFGGAAHERRVEVLAEVKTAFEELTGTAATRHAGRHYADRGVLFEECHAPVTGLVAGGELTRFVEEELAPLYDMVLVGPRLRMRREHALLADWVSSTFGEDRAVPLVDFYRGFTSDRAQITARCAEVDAELARVDDDMIAMMLGGAPAGDHELMVPRENIDALLARHPRTPPAVCNPDVMLAASSAEALDAGDFLAVVGDCHAMRELLTHGSLAPTVGERAPDVVDEMVRLYQGLLEPGEVLCDVVRAHLDKTDAQLAYPITDVEFFGRSGKDRRSVLSPAELHVRASAGRVGLWHLPSGQRIRLLAPPASGPSIARDPLAAFSFPRHFGGMAIRGDGRDHLPRFRSGRVVFQRERWFVDAAELTGAGPGGATLREGAAEMFAAAALRERRGLPRCVFAKLPGEPKPIYVDFSSPLLVRQLFRLARTSTGTVVFSEMLPGPDDLWLTGGGRRYTSEVRCAVFSSS
ncbi:lantibiotic dehydratase [Lentzea sp. JNUCC 0626]|uniref:lantibiotic dehydratase n=1 Tax=Lentzea sp. JNUCC 0626 TaxID=3367513 RepID=UPI003749A2BE